MTTTTTTTFSSTFLNEFDNLIFVTRIGDGWEDKWEILKSDNGGHFLDIDDAIDFIRTKKGLRVGLSTLKQAQLGNAEWDNL